MASLFVTRPDTARQRVVSNGGLGGFVTLGSVNVMDNGRGDGKSTWPQNRGGKKHKPAPVSIIQKSNKFFVKQEIPLQFAAPYTPRTPRTPVSRYNALSTPRSTSGDHLPPMPLTPKEQLLPSALELPGSLLLPSQGFPQSNPPCTPARLPALSRSSSEESDLVWTPAISVSSATDIEDDEMPKNFPPKHLPRAAEPTKARNNSMPAAHQLGIRKPLSAMNADELLDELPQMNIEAVKAIWIPAMVKQHENIKLLLQDAADVRSETLEFQDFDQVRGRTGDIFYSPIDESTQALNSLARDAHRITHTYEKAVNSAESLIERDTKSCRDQLEVTRTNLAAALVTIDNSHQTVRQKDETIQQLRYTLDDVVCVLGDFIQEFTPTSILRNVDHDAVSNVMQMLTDYSSMSCKIDGPAIRFLRVPEEHYMGKIDALREAQLKTERFREVAISQNQMISEQSAQLDSRLAAYEKSMGVIAERNCDVKMLADGNKQLRKTIEGFETGLLVSNSTRAVQDELFRDQEAMQSVLKNLKASHHIEIQQRDAEIRDLRRQLGSAREEVLRGKADVKNIITHTQALLSPTEPQEKFESTVPTLKERRMRKKAKGQPTALPVSQSMLSLGAQAKKPQAPLSIPVRRQSAGALLKSIDQPTFSMIPRDITPQWACGVSQRRTNTDEGYAINFSPNYAPRPRTDSCGYNNGQHGHPNGDHVIASAVVNQMLGAPVSFDPNKKLPSRPVPHYALDIYGGQNTQSMQEAENWYQQQDPQPRKQALVQPAIQRPRVLSQITERSVEDSTSDKASEKKTASATSSGPEAYRSDLQAVRMKDFINQTNNMTKGQSKEVDFKPDYEGNGYFAPAEGMILSEHVIGVPKLPEMVQSPVKQSQFVRVYESSQNSDSGSTLTTAKKYSPLRGVNGIRVDGDPWLSGSPARH